MPLAFLSCTLLGFDGLTQCTPDNTKTEFGAYGSLGKNKLPDAKLDSAYEEELTLVVPANIIGVTVDEVKLKSAPTLYTGLSYTCNPTSCVFRGGANGCITISGTPTVKGETNQDSVKLILTVTLLNLTPFDTTIYVDFNMPDSTTLNLSKSKNKQISIFPNPANNSISISNLSIANSEISISLTDLNGKMVHNEMLQPLNAPIEVPTAHFENGLYIMRLEYDNEVLVRKIRIQH